MEARSRETDPRREGTRQRIVRAAQVEFGRYGYAGTASDAIARRAGVSLPEIYGEFENKRDLILRCYEELIDRLIRAFEDAADGGGTPGAKLVRMGLAYRETINDLVDARFHLQILASSGAGDLRDPIRETFGRMFRETVRISGATEAEVAEFSGRGMMLTVQFTLGESAEMLDYLRMSDPAAK